MRLPYFATAVSYNHKMLITLAQIACSTKHFTFVNKANSKVFHRKYFNIGGTILLKNHANYCCKCFIVEACWFEHTIKSKCRTSYCYTKLLSLCRMSLRRVSGRRINCI
jgi:hypothetical protein